MDDLEEEKTGLMMRAEAAETKAKAANNQMQEAAKRNARQLAELKVLPTHMSPCFPNLVLHCCGVGCCIAPPSFSFLVTRFSAGP